MTRDVEISENLNYLENIICRVENLGVFRKFIILVQGNRNRQRVPKAYKPQ